MIDVKKLFTKILTSFVNKSGDTMTGDLLLDKDDPRIEWINEKINLKASNNGVSATTYTGHRMKDANGLDQAASYGAVTTAGLSRNGLWAYNYDSNGNLIGNNSFAVQVTKTGDLTYQMTSPKNFCAALGLGTVVDETAGSSGTISVASATATNIMSVSLGAGTWVITGTVAYQGGSSATAGSYMHCRIGTTSTGTQIAHAAVGCVKAGNTQVTTVGIKTFSATTTVYLSAQQGTGNSVNVAKGNTGIKAVRVSS